MNNYFYKQIQDIKKGLEPYLIKRNADLLFITIAIIMGLYYSWDSVGIVLYCFIVWLILNPWKSQDLVRIALFFLILTPISLIMEKNSYTEQFAIYAYYFLIFTIIRAIIERKTEAQSNQGDYSL